MFQQLYDILNGQNFDHEFERQIKLLSVLDERDEEYYLNLPIFDLKKECARTEFLSVVDMPTVKPPAYVTIQGHKFRIIYDIRDLCAGQLIDVMTSAKEADEHILNLDKTLAAFCLPVVKGKLGTYGKTMPFMEVADLMAKLPIVEASAIADFFYRVWNSFLKTIPDFLAKINKTRDLTEMEAITLAVALHADGDGSTALHKWQSLNA